jgi:hypothetical protein
VSDDEEQAWHSAELIRGVALCAPAVRMVVVLAFFVHEADGSKTLDHTVHPVVALRSACVSQWNIKCPLPRLPAPGANEEEMRGRGWRFSEEHIVDECMIVEDGALMSVSDALLCTTAHHEVVCAPWPESEDAAQLEEVIAGLYRGLTRQ